MSATSRPVKVTVKVFIAHRRSAGWGWARQRNWYCAMKRYSDCAMFVSDASTVPVQLGRRGALQ